VFRPILLAGTMLLASCATMPDITPAVRADLAPTGKIRAGINYGNFILAQKDKASGQSRGVAVDLANELGRRLGVPVEIVAYESVAALGDAAPTGAWDIAFLGSDPIRERIMSFTAAYVELDATYLVPAASPLRNAAEVDGAGLRVAAPARANYELYLQRNLKNAKLMSVQGNDAAFGLLAEGEADALAGLTEALITFSGKLPGSRIVEGRFMAVQQSIAVPKGRDAGLAYLRSVVEEAKASGLVARALAKTGARGVAVAPAAK
jgi:polar amino acid transport system substrate-binding protein